MSIQDPNQPQYTAPGASASYEPVTGAPVDAIPPYPGPPYPGAPGFVPGPGMPHMPNPALAALLGFIPGVGAMYNGQFAKGLAHIAIFALFSSLSKNASGFFGLFVAGWEFYMAFEAYQTAIARREGLPLPDPFGLNNVGERFGFRGNPDWGSFWAHGAPPSAGAPPVSETSYVNPATGAASYSRVDATGAQSSYHVDPAGNVYSSTTAAAPGVGYVPPVPPAAGYPPYGPPPPPPPFGAGYGVPAYGMPPVPPPAGFGAPPPRRSNLPISAFWLIGLGFVALLGSMKQFQFLEGEATGGLFLMGLGVFMFLRRQSIIGAFSTNNSPVARWGLLRASRGAGAVFIVGLLTFLQGLHVIYWESSWPILLIFLGVITLMERVALNNMNAAPMYPGAVGGPVAPAPAEPPVETSSPTSIVPKYTRPENDLTDQGGR